MKTVASPTTPPLEQFISEFRSANPDFQATDAQLSSYWERTYAPSPSVESMPTLDEFVAEMRTKVPGASEQELKTYWKDTYGSRGAREHEPTEDATRGFSTAFKQLPQLGHGLIAGVGATVEAAAGEGGVGTAIKEAGVKGYQEWGEKIAAQSKRSDSFSYAYDKAKEGDFGSLVDWMQYALGYGGGQAVQMLTTAGVGYVGGKLVLGEVAKQAAEKMVAKEIATIAGTEAAKKLTQQEIAKLATAQVAGRIGQTAAIGATAVGMEGGEIFGGLSEQAVAEKRPLSGEELAKAFGTTLAAGALEFVGDKFGLDVVLGRSPLSKLPSTVSKVARVGAAGVGTAAAEGATEYAQTLLEEIGQGRDPLSDAALREAIDSAALGAVAGGTMGTGGGLIQQVTTAPAKPPVPAAAPPPPKKDELAAVVEKVGPGKPAVGVDQAIAAAAAIVDAPATSPVTTEALDTAIAAQEGPQALPTTQPVEAPSVQDIHALADLRGVPWDNDVAFMDLTERVTGQRHLDTLTGPERTRVYDALFTLPAKPEGAVTLSPVLQAYLNRQPEAMHPYFRKKMEGFVPDAMADLAGTSVPIKVLDWADKTSALVKTPSGDTHLLSNAPTLLRPLPGQATVPQYQAKPYSATGSKNPAVIRPRQELPENESEHLRARAETALSLVVAGEPGRRQFTEQAGQGGTPIVTGIPSTYPKWYGPLKMPRQTVIKALEKIVKGAGADVGPSVERVKEAILDDATLDKLVGTYPTTALPEAEAVPEVPTAPPPVEPQPARVVLPEVPRAEHEAVPPAPPPPAAAVSVAPGKGDQAVKEQLKVKREARGPAPARTLNIIRGQKGAVKVAFPSQALTDLFSFGGRFRRSLEGKKPFDVESSQAFIRAQLQQPDLNVGAASIAYKEQVMAAIKELPEGATYEAPAYSAKAVTEEKPAVSETVVPETEKQKKVKAEKAKIEKMKTAAEEGRAEQPKPTLPGELFPGSETMEVGAKPLIAPEAPLSETPLFSKQAQTEEPEQVPLEPTPAAAIEQFVEQAPVEDEDTIKPWAVKLVDESQKDELAKRLKARMKGLSAKPTFDPRLMADAMQLGAILFQQGANKFAAWSQQMIETIGKEIRPYLRAIWSALRAIPAELTAIRPNVVASLFEYGNKIYDKGPIAEAEFIQRLNRAFGKVAGPYASAVFAGIDSFKKPKAEPALKAADPSKEISDEVAGRLSTALIDSKPITKDDLFAMADEAYGGTQAEGAYTPKDAFDAMELGVNKYLVKSGGKFNVSMPGATPAYVVSRIQVLRQLVLDKLPSQAGVRTEEQLEFQQFSTPHDLSLAMAWLANLRGDDVVLEPSAGTGDIAVWAKRGAGQVIVNELSPRRADLLRQLGFDRVLTENAEQLNNTYPDDLPKPTVVLMNPPFSATAGRMEGERQTLNVLSHIRQAFKLLLDGGRLIVLIGDHTGGYVKQEAVSDIHGKTALSQGVLKGLAALPGQLQASIRIGGEGYAKYGTTFTTRLLIYDKIAPTGEKPVHADVDNITAALAVLGEVRNARIRPAAEAGPAAQPERAEPGGPATPEPGRGGERGEQPVSVPAPPVGGEPGRDVQTETLGERLPAVPRKPGEPGGPGGGVPVSDRRPGEPKGTVARPGRPVSTGEPTRGGEVPHGQVPGGPDVGREPVTELPATGISLESGAESRVRHADEITDSIYEAYTPQKLKIQGAKPHPAKLVQSAAMGATEPPEPTYVPNLPRAVIDEGLLSLAQLETVVGAGQSHQIMLPNGERQGYYIGDGTGVGKGREISGIILDNFRQGRKKAIWISEKHNLAESAIRDWTEVGQSRDTIFMQNKFDGDKPIQNRNGILFTAYSMLARGSEVLPNGQIGQKNKTVKDEFSPTGRRVVGKEPSRLDQLVAWAGPDFDGVIAFDEAHNMSNSEGTAGVRGTTDPAAQAVVAVELQRRLPKARVVYVSATAAKSIDSMVYAERLGMWGEGTPFADRGDFIAKIMAGGLGSMEVVARDLKADGKYLARSLDNSEVVYDQLQHELTSAQLDIYNEMASAWQIVLQNIDAALQLTGVTGVDRNGRLRTKDKNAKGALYGRFWSAHQAFFMQILTALSMPTTLTRMQKVIDDGGSVVVSLVNTYEAAQERQLKRAKTEGIELEDLDLTPRENLMDYIRNGFPIHQYEDYRDDKGKVRARLALDSRGNPIVNKEAVAMRDALIEKLGSIKVPDSPIDQILSALGHDNVAEVTGRRSRLRRMPNGRVVQEKRSRTIANAEVAQFKNDKRRSLIFSHAGGTGESYDADKRIKNQRKRYLFVVQPGWQADKVIQAMGRVHRSNEVVAPNIILTSTNIKGHKRFISSVARRLDGIGAMTQGQRQTASSLISAQDNIENQYATAAVTSLMEDLVRGGVEGIPDAKGLLQRMGLADIVDPDTGEIYETKMPPVTRFLNRILALHVFEQNQVFDIFHERMVRYTEEAAARGELDVGMETYRADGGITVLSDQIAFTDPKSGARTNWLELEAKHGVTFVPFEEAQKGRGTKPVKGFYRNDQSGKIWAVEESYTNTDKTGNIVQMMRLQGPVHGQYHVITLSQLSGYTKIKPEEAKPWWENEIETHPPYRTEQLNMVTGALLKIWDRLPQTHVRIMRLQTVDGARYLGRIILNREVSDTKKKLGLGVSKVTATPAEIAQKVFDEAAVAMLANGWKIKRSLVSGDWRVELIGEGLQANKEAIQKAGGFLEVRYAQTRYFLPVGKKLAGAIAAITKNHPVVELIEVGAELMETQPSYGEVQLNILPEEGQEALAARLETKPEKKKRPSKGEILETMQDVGEKIGGARKDRWAGRGLRLEDLEGMTGGEESSFVTKQNIWKPDYVALIEGGMQPKAAAAVKIIYDRLAARPKMDNPEERRRYLAMISKIRDVFSEKKTFEAIEKIDSKELDADYETTHSVYKERAGTKPWRLDWQDERRINKLVAEGFPNQETWTRLLTVQKDSEAGSMTANGLEYTVKRVMRNPLWKDRFLPAAEDEAALRQAIKTRGLWIITRKSNGATEGWAASEEDAKTLAARVYETLKGTKETGDEMPERPHLDRLEREGPDYREGGVEREQINAAYDELFNQMQFKPTDKGMALYEPTAAYGPTFYSQVERVLQEKMPNRASMEQIRGILSEKNAVKPDELKWIGLDDYLKTKAYFTKEDALDFVRQNQVQVQEVEKGRIVLESNPEVQRLLKVLRDSGYEVSRSPAAENEIAFFKKDNPTDLMGSDEIREDDTVAGNAAFALEEISANPGADTKFASYTLPGGTDYRELLLTLPARTKIETKEYHDLLSKISDGTATEQEITIAKEIERTPNFTGGHFDVPNVLAHVRFNTRTDAEGKKVLFLEELQSDFGQKTRRSQEAVKSAVETDFQGIVDRMKQAGVLTVECD